MPTAKKRQPMCAGSAIGMHPDWEQALAEALAQTAAVRKKAGSVDLVLLFASDAYGRNLPKLVARAYEASGARVLIGCSGQSIIGTGREIEGQPVLSLLVASLPGAELRPVRLTQRMLAAAAGSDSWHAAMGVLPDDVNAWLLFVDPFHLDSERLVTELSRAYPGTPIVGGLASGDFRQQRTYVFLDDQVYDDGGVAIALGGNVTVETLVSQGCTPIGEPWTITSVSGNAIETISSRPAFQMLVETFRSLPEDVQQRAQRNIFAGLVIDEYRDRFDRGDFLVRNLLGADPQNGTIRVGAQPRIGQTIQFQLRDAATAAEDLRELLARTRERLGDRQPVGALLCTCNGRGTGLFGRADHDAGTVEEILGAVPVAGFFCNGEIGPIGSDNFVHGYTASLALFVEKT